MSLLMGVISRAPVELRIKGGVPLPDPSKDATLACATPSTKPSLHHVSRCPTYSPAALLNLTAAPRGGGSGGGRDPVCPIR